MTAPPGLRGPAVVRGALLTGAAAVLAFVDRTPFAGEGAIPWRSVMAMAAAAAALLAAALVRRARSRAVVFMWLAAVATALAGSRLFASSPAFSLFAILGLVSATLVLRGPRSAKPPASIGWVPAAWTVRGAAAVSTSLWLLALAGARAPELHVAIPLGLSSAIALALVLLWVRRFGAMFAGRRAILRISLILFVAVLPFAITRWSAFLGALAVVPTVALFALPLERTSGDEETDWLELLLAHPQRLFVLTFVLLCLTGTIALALPLSSASEHPIAYIDAFFTAVSAVCVTGLTVLDTPTAFSGAGKVLLVLLIQLGGLGIMTFSTAALGLLGRRLSLVHEAAVAGMFSGNDRSRVFRSVRTVLAVTFVSEGIGAAALTLMFHEAGEDLPTALGHGVFTAVSAFCNAGFALWSDSLVGFARHPGVLHVVAALIVLGGISPFVIVRLGAVARRRFALAQEKLVLATTGILLVAGTVLYAALEWNASLVHLPWTAKLTNAWFHSASLRTAGFNSVDLTVTTSATRMFMIVWMFIGGAPGGTAGGVKTTTVAVLALAVYAAVRGHAVAEVFHRRIPHATIYRAAAIATAGVASLITAHMVLLLTQRIPSELALFEVASALGTVGLTIGGTPLLDDLGKIVVAGCMFAGRVGPLTMFVFLIQKNVRDPFKRPEEDIDVG